MEAYNSRVLGNNKKYSSCEKKKTEARVCPFE